MVSIRVIEIKDEIFQDYKKPSMLIACINCDWKCCKDSGVPNTICQNYKLREKSKIKTLSNLEIVNRYLSNIITSGVIFGGLEPFMQFEEIISLIDCFRWETLDDIVIYTGYYEDEIIDKIAVLTKYKNIIIKFGRYVPNSQPIYDEILGVYLASDNQYAKKIS